MFPLLFFIEPLPKLAWPFFFVTIVIHVFYKIFLCKVYDYSGLSYGYPIARGLPSLILLLLTKTEILPKRQDAVVNHKGQGLAEVTIKELIEAGAHFGHQKYRWNPKMKRYIWSSHQKLHIINLEHSLPMFRDALSLSLIHI